jgi:hypothetical protein
MKRPSFCTFLSFFESVSETAANVDQASTQTTYQLRVSY